MSETFNKYFTEIGTNLADQLPNPSKSFNTFLDPVTCSFQLEPVSLSKVLKLLKNLPINKATGLDKIPCRLVNLAAPLIAESLCCIFNTSISSNIFPSDWKIAKIIPIHKGNAKDDLNNYRPISILSPISKIFERLTSYTTIFPIMGFYRSVNPAFDDIILPLHHYLTLPMNGMPIWIKEN